MRSMAKGVRFDVEQQQNKDWVRVEDRVIRLGLGETLRLQITNAGAATVWVAPVVRIQRPAKSDGFIGSPPWLEPVRHESEPANPLELAPGASGTLAVTLKDPDVATIGLVAAPTAQSAEVVDTRALQRKLVDQLLIKFLGSPEAETGFDEPAYDAGEISFNCLIYAGCVLWWAESTIDTRYGHPLDEGTPALIGLMVSLAVAIGYVAYTGYWRRWLFWRPPPFVTRKVGVRVVEIVMMFTLLTSLFIYLHAFLLSSDVIGASTKVPEDGLIESAAGFYLWNLIKSIPVLELTDTFDLKPPITFTGVTNGLLLLTYRLLVLVPIIGLGLSVLQHWLGRDRDTSSG